MLNAEPQQVRCARNSPDARTCQGPAADEVERMVRHHSYSSMGTLPMSGSLLHADSHIFPWILEAPGDMVSPIVGYRFCYSSSG